jgi:hypothetical protein
MGAFSVIYNLPLYYQVVLNLSAAGSGLRLIPNSIGSSLGSLGYGLLMAKTVVQISYYINGRDDITGLVCLPMLFSLLEQQF